MCKQEDPRDQSLLFQVMFDTACRSKSVWTRRDMGYIIEKMYDPRLNGCNRAWGKVKWIGLTPDHYTISAGKIDHLQGNLIRFGLLEKLNIIRLFHFKPTKDPEATVEVNGTQVNQTQWVYDQVIRIIPKDRILVSKYVSHRLINLPTDYRVLDPRFNPAKYLSYNDSKYLQDGVHFYETR